ncbi:hypothetical protein ATCC51561_838 [Campylobacter concisus ATCC 51561]|nr:hypothetical protein ATCC51561_838 [Campylobacter concisus ATCC 51561]
MICRLANLINLSLFLLQILFMILIRYKACTYKNKNRYS